MNTIELFDYCQEIDVKTVPYSAHKDTIARWYQEARPLVLLGTSPQYVYCERIDMREQHLTVIDGQITYSTIPFNDLDIDIPYLVDKLWMRFNLANYTLFFYQDNGNAIITGIGV